MIIACKREIPDEECDLLQIKLKDFRINIKRIKIRRGLKREKSFMCRMNAARKVGEHPVICVSAKDETGFEQLEDTLKNMFLEGSLSFNDEVCITNMRHKAALMDAKESLKQVTESIAQDMPEDFFSIDLMSAYESLGTIIGEAVDDDLVNEIFSKFCMGK